MTSVVPANIALIAGGKNPDEAKKFMAFSMSTEGQQLLFDPKISRLPIRPYSQLKAPAGYPDPQEVAKRAKVQFDADLSEARYQVVTSLFDQMVTFRLKELKGATKAIHEAEKALIAKPNAWRRSGQAGAQPGLHAARGRREREERTIPGAVPQEPARRGSLQAALRARAVVGQQGA